jgi:hypothetical protein
MRIATIDDFRALAEDTYERRFICIKSLADTRLGYGSKNKRELSFNYGQLLKYDTSTHAFVIVYEGLTGKAYTYIRDSKCPHCGKCIGVVKEGEKRSATVRGDLFEKLYKRKVDICKNCYNNQWNNIQFFNQCGLFRRLEIKLQDLPCPKSIGPLAHFNTVGVDINHSSHSVLGLPCTPLAN